MELNVSLIFRNESPPKMFPIRVTLQQNSTISSLREHIIKRHGIPDNQSVKILFGGKVIDDDNHIHTLSMGQCTVLHAIVTNRIDDKNRANFKSVLPAIRHPTDGQFTSSYFVFCKAESCNKLRNGKLRVRCSQCKSEAIELNGDPTCWNDVLISNSIDAKCLQKNCDETTAQFYFKCAYCSDSTQHVNEIAMPLSQIHLNRHASLCSTCGDISNAVMDFQCALPENHVMCIDCFVAYANLSLDERKYVFTKSNGYTLSCPVAHCTGLIREPHHFRLLGKEKYDQFQQMATERCILEEEAIFCPSPNCGAAYIVENDGTTDEGATGFCPACGCCFCRLCKFSSSECVCSANEHDANTVNSTQGASATVILARQSLSMIDEICKPCPKCKYAT